MAAKPVSPLPPSLVASLPAAKEIVDHVAAISRLVPVLEKQLRASRKRGVIPLAQSFCIFHRLIAVVDDKLKPLKALFELYKAQEMPAALEDAGITHVPLDAGYRIAVSYVTRASIKGDNKLAAYDWLKANFPDCVSETVNASTLSALARELSEEQNRDLPDDMFTVALVPNTSVTAIK